MENKPKMKNKYEGNDKKKKNKPKVKIYANKKRQNNSEKNVIENLRAKYESVYFIYTLTFHYFYVFPLFPDK